MLAVILGLVVAAAVAHRAKALHADERSITLASLAGSFAVSDRGFFTFCVGGCAAPTNLIPVNVVQVGQQTFDDSGNFCAVVTGIGAAVIQKAPAIFSAFTVAGAVTAFDPTTGTGDVTATGYNGGSCTGAVFNSAGSTPEATVTQKIVVSQNANHIAFAAKVTRLDGTTAGHFFLGALDRQHLRQTGDD